MYKMSEHITTYQHRPDDENTTAPFVLYETVPEAGGSVRLAQSIIVQ